MEKTVVEKIQDALTEQDLEKVYQIYHQFFDNFHPSQMDELVDIAAYSMAIGFYEEAKRAYLLLTELEPSESAWTILLAEILVSEAEYDQALSILYDIPETDENYTSVLVVMSELYRAQGYYDIAERKLLLAKQLAPNEMMIDFYLGTLLFEVGAFERSVNFLERFVRNEHEETGEEHRARELWIEASLELGNVEPLEQLIAEEGLDSVSSELLTTIANYKMQQQSYDEALEIYQQLLLRDEEQLAALIGIAEVSIAKQDYAVAKEYLEKVIEAYPYEVQGFRLLAVVYEANGDVQLAQQAYQQAYELAPDSFDILQEYIEFLLTVEEYETAQQLLADIIEQGFENGTIDYWMAKAYEGLEEYAEALEYYQRASEELDDSVSFIVDYVRFLREEGRLTEAQEWLEHGLTLEPLNEELYQLRQYMEE